MANANLFQAYLQPARSVLDYQNDFDKQESNKLALVGQRRNNELAGLTMEQTRGQIADASAKRNAIQEVFAKLGPQADPLTRARALQANPLTAQEGVAAEKSILENDKTRAGTSKDQAEADAKNAAMKYEAATHHAQGLAYVQTPADVVTYVDQGIAKGIFPMAARDQMLAKAQSYPSIDAWKQAAGQAAVPVIDKFKQDAESARNAATNATHVQTTGMTNDTSRANNRDTLAQGDRHFNATQATANQAVTYQPDGDGGFVALPTKLAPGQAPQGRAAIDANGAPIKAKGGGLPKMSAEVQRQIGGVVSFDKDLSALEEALKDFNPRNPLDQGNTTKRARIESLSKQAQLSAKEAAALGALSGPDMALLEGILNDPTNLRGALAGSGGIAAQISEARKGNQRRVKSLQEQYGEKATAGISIGTKAPSALHDAADAILAGQPVPKGFALGGPVYGWRRPQQAEPMMAPDLSGPQAPIDPPTQPTRVDGVPQVLSPTWGAPTRVDGVPQGLPRFQPPRRTWGGRPNAMQAFADGGPVPRVGSRTPLPQGETGGGLSHSALMSAANAQPPSRSFVNPMNQRAVMADRERRADLTPGGEANGPAGVDKIDAKLTDGEHVLTVDEVTALGDGNNALGQQRLLAWRKKLMGR